MYLLLVADFDNSELFVQKWEKLASMVKVSMVRGWVRVGVRVRIAAAAYR